MKERTDFEFRWYTVSRIIEADENTGSCQHGHFRVTDFVGLAARHDEPKGLKRTLGQEFAKRLKRHIKIITRSHRRAEGLPVVRKLDSLPPNGVFFMRKYALLTLLVCSCGLAAMPGTQVPA